MIWWKWALLWAMMVLGTYLAFRLICRANSYIERKIVEDERRRLEQDYGRYQDIDKHRETSDK
jgi:hypothetical protein